MELEQQQTVFAPQRYVCKVEPLWDQDPASLDQDPQQGRKEPPALQVKEEPEDREHPEDQEDREHPEDPEGRWAVEGGGQFLLKEENDFFLQTRAEGARNRPASQNRCGTSASKVRLECSFCGKAFRFVSQVEKHHRIHTGEKPYSCQACGKRFVQKQHLQAHMLIHTGEKPYSCETCGKRFKQKKSLLIHMKIHTGEKPYLCNTCGKRFTDPSTLRKHAVIHTGLRSGGARQKEGGSGGGPAGPWRVTFSRNLLPNGPRRLALTPQSLHPVTRARPDRTGPDQDPELQPREVSIRTATSTAGMAAIPSGGSLVAATDYYRRRIGSTSSSSSCGSSEFSGEVIPHPPGLPKQDSGHWWSSFFFGKPPGMSPVTEEAQQKAGVPGAMVTNGQITCVAREMVMQRQVSESSEAGTPTSP